MVIDEVQKVRLNQDFKSVLKNDIPFGSANNIKKQLFRKEMNENLAKTRRKVAHNNAGPKKINKFDRQ